MHNNCLSTGRLKKTKDEMNKVSRLQDMAVDILNGNYSDELVPNLASITCSSVATLNMLEDQKRSQSVQSLNNGKKVHISLLKLCYRLSII